MGEKIKKLSDKVTAEDAKALINLYGKYLETFYNAVKPSQQAEAVLSSAIETFNEFIDLANEGNI